MRMLLRGALTAVALLALLSAPLALADVVAVAAVPADPWAKFWADIQGPLVVFVTAVLGLLGSIVAYYANKFLGASGSKAVTAMWQMGTDAAAGWLAHQLAGPLKDTAAQPLSVDHPAVQSAIGYMKDSFPKAIAAVKPSDNEIGRDIIAAVGAKFLPGPLGAIIGGVLGAGGLKRP